MSNAGAFGTIMNIAKNIVGAGVLSVPQMVFEGTVPISLSMLVVMGLINMFSFWAVGVLSGGSAFLRGK